MRWNDIEPVWQASLDEAWAAYCAGSLPIGAVVVDAAGQIIGRGRNRIFDKSAPPSADIYDDPHANRPVFNHDLAHAELNALLSLRNVNWDKTKPNNPHHWRLYTTMEPCPLCLGAFYMAGLRQLHFAARDPYSGSVNLLGTTPYLRSKPIRVVGPHPELEALSIALAMEAVQRDEPPERSQQTQELWRKTSPMGVALGEWLFEHQSLQQLRSNAAMTLEVVEQVVQAAALLTKAI